MLHRTFGSAVPFNLVLDIALRQRSKSRQRISVERILPGIAIPDSVLITNYLDGNDHSTASELTVLSDSVVKGPVSRDRELQ